MNRREFILAAIASVGLAVITACRPGNGERSPGIREGASLQPELTPEVVEWSIGPKGGLNEGSSLITQASWEPKRIEVPLNRSFKIRFTSRDNRIHPIVFSKSLKEEVGMDLPTLEISNGQPGETPVMRIKAEGKAFDVFCREHRGVGGFGSIVTPTK